MTWPRFLALLERHGWPALPVAEWRSELGADSVAALRRAGFFEVRGLDEGDWFPCPSPFGDGCPRRVVRFGDRLTAVCGQAVEQCLDVPIPEADAQVLAVTPHSLRAALAGPARLEVRSDEAARGGRARLGERRFGEGRAALWYAPWLRGAAAEDWVEVVAARERRVDAVGVLVPRAASVGTGVLARLRDLRVTPLPLEDVVRIDGEGVSVDLADLVLQHRFPGVELGVELYPRFDLVIEPATGGFWWKGRPLPTLKRRRIAASMLIALAERPGELVTRDELCRAMWPDEYGARGSHERDWDRMVKQQKRLLVMALEEDRGEDQPLVEAVAAGSDLDGGCRLTGIGPVRVARTWP